MLNNEGSCGLKSPMHVGDVKQQFTIDGLSIIDAVIMIVDISLHM